MEFKKSPDKRQLWIVSYNWTRICSLFAHPETLKSEVCLVPQICNDQCSVQHADMGGGGVTTVQ